MTAKPLYARCTELDVDNSYEGMIWKKESLEAVPRHLESVCHIHPVQLPVNISSDTRRYGANS